MGTQLYESIIRQHCNTATLQHCNTAGPVSRARQVTRISFLVCAAFALLASPAAAAPRILDLDAPALHIEAVTINQGASFCFTTDSPQGVDPVAYLLGPDGLGGWTQFAYHDDVNYPSDPDVQLCWTNSTAFTTFLVVLRAWSPGDAGTTTTQVQGQLARNNVPVGGVLVTAGLLQRQAGDVVRTAHVPGGSVAQMVFRMNGVYDIAQMAAVNSTAQAAEVLASDTDVYYLLGTPSYVTPSEWFVARPGAVRLTSNDVATDSDGDGLGNALEQELQTCWQTTNCPNAANGHGRDTDRDGVDDYEELYGVAGTDPDGLDDVDLARWGANPRKKDIFVEVDHLAQLGTLPLGTNPFQWMRDYPTSPIGSFPAGITPEAWVAKLQQPFDAAPNGHVRNPDGSHGVQVHLDLGVQPLVATDERKFGDWGGLGQRMVVEDRRIEVEVRGPGDPPGDTVTVGTFVTLQVNGSSRTFSAGGMNASDICYGLMFQLLAVILEDGEPVQLVSDACGDAKPWFRMGTSQSNVPFEVTVGAAPAIGGDPLQVFLVVSGFGDGELVHAKYWSASTYRDNSRRGRVRYGIVRGLWGGGKGMAPGVAFTAGLQHHEVFTHELGHTLALTHNGHPQWGSAGVDCQPHYFSTMRYGSPDYKFADSDAGLTLNPADTVEEHTFGPAFDHSVFAGAPYHYPVAATNVSRVDWNRDELPGDATTGWRSLSLATPGSSCRSFVQGAQSLADVADGPTGAVDLQRIGDRLYAFWVASGQHVRYRFADLELGNTKACTGSSDPQSGDCLTWSATLTLISDTSTHDAIFGITAVHHEDQLFLATRSAVHGRRLRIWRCNVGLDGTLSIVDQTDAPEHPALLFPRQYRSDFAPELVVMHRPGSANQDFGLGLLYLDADGTGTVQTYRSYGWNGSDWVHLGAMLDTAGNPIQGRRPPAAKAWPGGDLGWLGSEKRTLAVLPAADDKVRVYELEHATDRWFLLDTLDVDQGTVSGYTTGRPFLEFRPVRDAAGQVTAQFAGHLMVGWLDPRPNEGDVAYLRFSTIISRTAPPSVVVTPSGGLPTRVSQVDETVFHDWVQNTWATQAPGTTVALYGDPQLDNVFGLTWIDTGDSWSSGLYFLPHADGSPNTPLTTYSDFRVMEDGICEGLLADGPPYAPSCGPLNHID